MNHQDRLAERQQLIERIKELEKENAVPSHLFHPAKSY